MGIDSVQCARDKREFVDRINSAKEWLVGAHAFLDNSQTIVIDLWKNVPPRNFVIVECSAQILHDYLESVRVEGKGIANSTDFEWDIDRALDDLDLRPFEQPVMRFHEAKKTWYLAEATLNPGTLPDPLPEPLRPPDFEGTFYSPDEFTE